jgi:hypothetical protein
MIMGVIMPGWEVFEIISCFCGGDFRYVPGDGEKNTSSAISACRKRRPSETGKGQQLFQYWI